MSLQATVVGGTTLTLKAEVTNLTVKMAGTVIEQVGGGGGSSPDASYSDGVITKGLITQAVFDTIATGDNIVVHRNVNTASRFETVLNNHLPGGTESPDHAMWIIANATYAVSVATINYAVKPNQFYYVAPRSNQAHLLIDLSGFSGGGGGGISEDEAINLINTAFTNGIQPWARSAPSNADGHGNQFYPAADVLAKDPVQHYVPVPNSEGNIVWQLLTEDSFAQSVKAKLDGSLVRQVALLQFEYADGAIVWTKRSEFEAAAKSISIQVPNPELITSEIWVEGEIEGQPALARTKLTSATAVLNLRINDATAGVITADTSLNATLRFYDAANAGNEIERYQYNIPVVQLPDLSPYQTQAEVDARIKAVPSPVIIVSNIVSYDATQNRFEDSSGDEVVVPNGSIVTLTQAIYDAAVADADFTPNANAIFLTR